MTCRYLELHEFALKKHDKKYYSVPKKKNCFNVKYFENEQAFLLQLWHVSSKYTIHRSNIKAMPCWAEIFASYGNT